MGLGNFLQAGAAMNHGTCIHFSGIDMGPRYKENCCKAGINYFETFNGRQVGMFLRMPCVEFRELPAHGRGTIIKPGEPTIRKEIDRKGEVVIPCPLRQAPTDEQVHAYRLDNDEWLKKAFVALRVAAEWRVQPKPDNDRSDVVECPVCEGKLHLYQSSRNGHTSGKCETNGCISWIE